MLVICQYRGIDEGMMRLTSCGDFLSSSRDTNDDTLTPTLVASLQRSTHNTNITRAVKGVIKTTIGHLNQLLLNGLVLKLGRVHEIRGTKLVSPFLLLGVQVDDNDLASLPLNGAL